MTLTASILLSIVIPLKDEAENITALAGEINAALASLDGAWECVWIDDGSTDDSPRLLRELAGSDPRHRVITFAANAGQSAALWAGFKTAEGALIGTLDADRQNDPADLPVLVERIQSEGCDMINGYRQKRQDSPVRKIASRLANGFRNRLTGRTVRDVGCSTRVFKKACVADLPAFKGMHRFLPTLIAMRGFTLAEVPVNHRPRPAGTSKYTINNRLWVGLADVFGVLWLRKRAFAYQIKPT